MNKITKYILFTYLLMFFCMFNVNADCSYQERKEMLNEAKEVEAFFEADIDNNKFVFYIYNLTDNIYVALENPQTYQYREIFKYMYDTEYYTYDEENITDIINYKLKIYSNKSGCYGNIITTKTIKKPIINKYYKQEVCKGIEDFKYCTPILNIKPNLEEKEIYNAINKYREQVEISEDKTTIEKFGLDDLKDIIIEYWYVVIIIIIVLTASVIIVKYIIKKRGELK